jgi:hypothetical protein
MIDKEKKIVQDAMQEMINSMTRVAAERDLMKEIVSKVKEETQVAPKVFKKMARVAFKANFSEEVALHEEFEELYQQVIS